MFRWRLGSPLVDIHVTMEPDPHTALWHMYATARAESISAQQMMEMVVGWTMAGVGALVAAIGVLVSAKIEPALVQFSGWGLTVSVGLLAASEYMTQTGRMLRAGYFARQLERKAGEALGVLPHDATWEVFLSGRGGRLFPGYWLTGATTIVLLASVQFMPFLLYPLADRLFLRCWWAFPICGTLLVFLTSIAQFLVYRSRYPIQDQLTNGLS